MRVIAGQYRSRKLKTRKGLALRPTSDRLRETLFNILAPEIPGSVFLDCYAGSGAVGLEALSRGAAQVLFLEEHLSALRLIQENFAALGAEETVCIIRGPVRVGLRKLERQGVRANICFLDPPYAALPEALRNLRWLSARSLMLPQGIVVLEHARKTPAPEQIGTWKRVRLLEQGSSALSFYRRESARAGSHG
jgi:16S rRNA (guanine(966)-N(2))-methyltransferase RsmD